MPFATSYDQPEPLRTDVEALPGPTVLEFGATWCGFCQGAQPAIEKAVDEYPQVRHIKVGAGKGKPLGRSYTVKLWPTLIFLRDGQEVARVVRPSDADEVRNGLSAITQPSRTSS